jgi:hypothetical protein
MAELTNDLATYARLDWLAYGRWDRLHCPTEADYDDTDWLAYDVTFACGRRRPVAVLPGVFTRMSAPRCAQCCDRSGLPRGDGSPKNDAECRRILGLDGASG